MSFSYNLLRRIVPPLQSVDKPLCFLKMGSQGRSPRQGLGAVAPVKSPFPGKGGKGDRDSKSEVYFKNRLLLRTYRREKITAVSINLFSLRRGAYTSH